MSTLTRIAPIGLVASLLLLSCDRSVDPADGEAPGRVGDLRFHGRVGEDFTILWTAPGDDGALGTASQYDLRLSSVPITAETWPDALPVSDPPVPGIAGAGQSFVLSVPASQVVYIALKTSDEVPNWSELSNVATNQLLADGIAPAAVTDLRAQQSLAQFVTIAWTAPGDDGNDGTAARYDIRYSTGLITESTWESATRVSDVPTPAPAGSAEVLRIESPFRSQIFVALRAVDDVGNWSGLSNVAFAFDSSAAPPPPETVLVPAGVFMMGDGHSGCGEDEHEVNLTRAFRLGRYEVTNGEYMAALQWAFDCGLVTVTPDGGSVQDALDGSTEELVDLDDLDGDCEIAFRDGVFELRQATATDAIHAYPDGYDPSDHPMKEVSWCGAVAYCDWLSLMEFLPRAYDHATWDCNDGDPYGALGYRLPTDAEWEYAARWGHDKTYPWGDRPPDSTLCNYAGLVDWSTPKGSFLGWPRIAGVEVFDMAGNVREYCNDWYHCNLNTLPQVDPPGPTSGYARVTHGGDFQYFSSYACAYRTYQFVNSTSRSDGFRIARTVE
ncbi:MAG: SUMF1/EgtB/PvdO family nonheme iron enzyme [Gemmatimonadetes bacterium]|nr:SUMF1/EgtB/PvdO family nonheme iron enzyme [Gemmatimonadota bacterium]